MMWMTDMPQGAKAVRASQASRGVSHGAGQERTASCGSAHSVNGVAPEGGKTVSGMTMQGGKAVSGVTMQSAKDGGRKNAKDGVDLRISEMMQKMYQEQADRVRESGETTQDALVDIGKVMETARRIARGDKVPSRDEKKLMEYSPDLYQMAKSAAMLNARKKHKKHKSLYEDEDGSTIEEKLRELFDEDGEQSQSMEDI